MRKLAAKKILILLGVCMYSFLLSSCVKQSDVRLPVLEDYYRKVPNEEKINLKMGLVAGPYQDIFNEIVEPLFTKKGYNVEIVTYSNYVDPNFALANGDIDFNVFQHYKYLNNFKFEHGLNLSAIAEVPTMPMGVYSYKYDAIDELEEGAVIAIPDDSTNLSRALMVLSTAGAILVSPEVEASKLTLNDITKNPKNIEFVLTEAHLLCDALEECDLAVINGNFAINGGLEISDTIFTETLANHEYINVIAVRTNDLGRQFVMDLIDVLRSEEYVRAITEEGGKYSRFQYPCNFSPYLTEVTE